MKIIKYILPSLLTILIVGGMSSCKKDPGFEGKASISGVVTYPGGVAPAAIINIAFDESSATTSFDYTAATNANGEYSINQLAKGDYYIDAQYTDGTGFTFHTGGYLVEIGGNKEDVTVDIVLK